jgi:hypothetical protein
MFDAIIVIVSFVLDIVFRNNDGPESGAGLLVVLRLWRVTRILNGKLFSVFSVINLFLHNLCSREEI